MTIATAEPIDTELQPPDMVWVAGASFVMGSDNHYPEEGPAHEVSVDGFWIDPTPVTNAQFQRFVATTGHVTVAEQTPNAADYPGAKPELLVPASAVFRRPEHCGAVAHEAAAAGAGALWLQLGVVSPEARRVAEEHGMDFVENECTAIVHRRI